MNREQKVRYRELKLKNKEQNDKQQYENNELLRECMKALGTDGYPLNDKEYCQIYDRFISRVPFLPWGVDWDNIDRVNNIHDINDIAQICLNREYYIIWGRGIPIIKSNIFSIIKAVDDITAVNVDTWLFGKNNNEIIEFHHEGKIRIGQIEKSE